MSARLRSAITVSAVGGLASLFAGCLFEFQKEPRSNAPPITFFDVSPADTTYSNEAFFTWLGTDLDSDVVAYQYQLVETDSLYYYSAGQQGTVLRSIVPRREFTGSETDTFVWTDRTLDNSQAFSNLDDGWYEMRARAIDDAGQASSAPALRRFYVFYDDVEPRALISPDCGRIPNQSWTFSIDATDESRNAVTPRSQLEVRYELKGRRESECDGIHVRDGWTPSGDVWAKFPTDGSPIVVEYTDLTSAICGWDFKVEVRDPARNVGKSECCITKTGGCF
jgi:hypothetical protein